MRGLRAWQREALEKYVDEAPRDFLAVATPGAGKTTFALTVARLLLDTRVVYLCPRLNPDGAELALADKPRFIRSSTRPYPHDEQPVDGLNVEDIDGDGRGDLVGRRKGRLVTFTGTKKGGFSRRAHRKVKTGSYTQLLGPGDVTGDGNNDVLGLSAKRLFVLPGRGNGTFRKKRRVPGSWRGVTRVIGGGDYTGDGRADLLVKTRRGGVFLRPGRGDGTFSRPMGPTANLRGLTHLSSAGNLLGTPGPDLVGVKKNGQLLAVANRGTYDLGAPIDAGVSFAGMNLVINAGDVNRDGFGDVVTRNPAGQLWLWRGNGQGSLQAGVHIADGFATVSGLTSPGDVTGDGAPDLVGTPAGGQPTVWTGNGTGYQPGALIAGRMQARAGLPSDLAAFDWVIGVSAMGLKGSDDFVVRKAGTGRLYLYQGRKSGVGRARLLGEGLEGYDLAG